VSSFLYFHVIHIQFSEEYKSTYVQYFHCTVTQLSTFAKYIKFIKSQRPYTY